MVLSQINQLKNKILKKDSESQSQLTSTISIMKELGCLPDIIGRDYEVRSPKGELLYIIRQKPMAMKQLNTLHKELDILHRVEEENSKNPKKKRSRLN